MDIREHVLADYVDLRLRVAQASVLLTRVERANPGVVGISAALRLLLDREQIAAAIAADRADVPADLFALVTEGLTEPPFSTLLAEMLPMLADGMSNAEIADERFVSLQTVKTQIASMLRDSDTSSRAELVALAYRERWIA